MQTAAFKALEVDIGRSSKLVSAMLGRAVDLTHLASLQALTTGIRDVWFGYALAPATGAANPVNVLVYRGTQSVEEWLEALAIAQIDVPLVWFSDGRFQIAKASVGFLLV